MICSDDGWALMRPASSCCQREGGRRRGGGGEAAGKATRRRWGRRRATTHLCIDVPKRRRERHARRRRRRRGGQVTPRGLWLWNPVADKVRVRGRVRHRRSQRPWRQRARPLHPAHAELETPPRRRRRRRARRVHQHDARHHTNTGRDQYQRPKCLIVSSSRRLLPSLPA